MRVVVLGGTRFVGRAIVEELAGRGHEVTVVHRGLTTPADMVDVAHLLVDRAGLASCRADLAALQPDVVLDTAAMSGADADAAVEALPGDLPAVVLSSMDVYEAYGDLRAGRATSEVPFDEDAPLRRRRHPYRGGSGGLDDYEKLEVEEVYRRRGASVCRLPMVFGPHDHQRREEFALRRVRAGRTRLPFGPGGWRWSRLHAGDVATAVTEVIERGIQGEVLNIGPSTTPTIRQWTDDILTAAGARPGLVPVADTELPHDLWISGSIAQDLVADSSKARSMLDWADRDPTTATADSVRWHLDHPPDDPDGDFTADDRALATVDEPQRREAT